MYAGTQFVYSGLPPADHRWSVGAGGAQLAIQKNTKHLKMFTNLRNVQGTFPTTYYCSQLFKNVAFEKVFTLC